MADWSLENAPFYPQKSFMSLKTKDSKKRKFLRFMKGTSQRRLTVEGPRLLTPYPLFLVEGWELLLPAFLDGELKAKGQPSASQPEPWCRQGAKFELRGDAETFTAG